LKSRQFRKTTKSKAIDAHASAWALLDYLVVKVVENLKKQII